MCVYLYILVLQIMNFIGVLMQKVGLRIWFSNEQSLDIL